MTPDASTSGTPLDPKPSPYPLNAAAPSPSPAAKGRRRVWFQVVAVVLLLAGGAVGAWWWFHRPVAAVPPMPQNVQDPEVRRAIERARKKVLDQPGDANAWGYLGMILLAHEFLAEADPCFAEAARLQPKSPTWPYGRGLIALKRDPDRALPFLRQALSAAGNSWPEYQSVARLQLAEAHLERAELPEAEKLFREEWDRQPDEPRAALGLGQLALLRDENRAAEQFLNTARTSPSARKKATALLAILARGRREDTAAAAFDRETDALPDDLPWPDPLRNEIEQLQVGHFAWLRQENQLEEQQLFTAAAQVYLEEIAEQPTARAYARAGYNLAQSGDYDRALPYLRAGVRLDPNSAHAHFLLALTLYVRAEQEWKQSANSPRAREWFQEAVVHAQKTAELRPTQSSAYLFWGLALKNLDKPDLAIKPLRQGVECAPGDFKLQLTLGEVLLETGQDREAEIHLENAHQLNPHDPRPEQALKRLHNKKL